MSAAELLLAGKDWFREPEAAEYCGLSVADFRKWYREAGITPKRVGTGARGRKLYSRSDLYRAIDGSPEWQRSTPAGKPGISVGQRAVSTSADPSERLRAQRLREYAPRKQRS
jgi:hypothetical protein